MTTDEGTGLAPSGGEVSTATADEVEPEGSSARPTGEGAPNFWHRDHPVFLPLAGFFTGTLLVVLVLGVLGLVLNALFDVELSEHPGPFFVAILALFVLNVVLLVAPTTRRFAGYMLFGLLATPLVVGGVAALTLLLLIKNDG